MIWTHLILHNTCSWFSLIKHHHHLLNVNFFIAGSVFLQHCAMDSNKVPRLWVPMVESCSGLAYSTFFHVVHPRLHGLPLDEDTRRYKNSTFYKILQVFYYLWLLYSKYLHTMITKLCFLVKAWMYVRDSQECSIFLSNYQSGSSFLKWRFPAPSWAIIHHR
jgi:hypothetical protein